MTRRSWTWLAAIALSPLALLALAALWLAVFGWNWARGPLQDQALQRTGRVLNIAGDLTLAWAWPAPQLRAQGVAFANPPWAGEAQMLQADSVMATVDLPALLRGQLSLPTLQLTRPRVFLEQASGGRRTWLLDRTQTDEAARILIGRVLLDHGELTYTDTDRHTRVHAALSTQGDGGAPVASDGAARNLVFSAEGRLLGQALQATGSGGAVVAWRDESTPYPLQVKATLDHIRVEAEGTVTRLFQLNAMDLRLVLDGDSLAALYPLIGVALPPTPAYRSTGHLVRSGTLWRYENFVGRVGHSDIAGSLQVDTAHPRPQLTGALVSRQLSLADLGPAVGSRRAAAEGGKAALPRPARLLPDMPFETARWASLDADVTLRAQTLLRDEALPLDQLQFRLLLQNGVLTLDPLAFSLAGGQLQGVITLDSRKTPLQGRARMQVRGLVLGRLLPTVDLSQNSIGLLHGDIELDGQGASVGRMLADETLDLTIVPHTKVSSLVALRSPVHVRGTFSQPRVTLDAGRIATRGVGALALGLLNPLLALIPLFEAGPGVDSACAKWVAEAKQPLPPPPAVRRGRAPAASR